MAKELVAEIVSEEEEELKVDENDLCPTLLIKRGNKVMLFNKNVPETPGENPIFFDNLGTIYSICEKTTRII